jgi:RimJ/RimL family protein N-acetyltransferase
MDLMTERLEHGSVSLELLAEQHREELRAACNADPEIWAIYPYSMAGEHFGAWWDAAMARQGHQSITFATCLDGRCVGTSSYLNIEPGAAVVEIGGTYFAPDARGGIVNPSAKLMMLRHAFERGARRVAFRVDALNSRSRAAVLKLGAVQEGILRQSGVTWTGRVRDTVVFSILRDEWPEVERRLLRRLNDNQRPSTSLGTSGI